MNNPPIPSHKMQAHIAYAIGTQAEAANELDKAKQAYMFALRSDPTYTQAIARLGHLRFVEPAQPILGGLRKETPDVPGIITVQVRNPCNFRCFYCAAKGHNNEPVERFDLDAMKAQLDKIKIFYDSINVPFIVCDLECGGGEPTVHPQFKALMELLSNYGAVSFPSNNSQDPKRWLPQERTQRLLVISCLHPEAEANIDRYLKNARYLLDQGCWFQG